MNDCNWSFASSTSGFALFFFAFALIALVRATAWIADGFTGLKIGW
jgi:hypothetical protein